MKRVNIRTALIVFCVLSGALLAALVVRDLWRGDFFLADAGPEDGSPATGSDGAASPPDVVEDNFAATTELTMSVSRQTRVLPDGRGPDNWAKWAAAHAVSRSLPEGVVVITEPPDDFADLVSAYRQALARAARGERRVKPGCGLSIVAVGPILSPHESVEVRCLSCVAGRVGLEIGYGRPRGGMVAPDGSTGWRPVLVVPLLLPPAAYGLDVSWQAVRQLYDEEPLPQPPIRHASAFEITRPLSQSRSVRAGGAAFQTLAESPCRLSSSGKQRSVHLGLRITNRTTSPLVFNMDGLYFARDGLCGEGPQPQGGSGCYRSLIVPPLTLAPAMSHLWIVRGDLSRGGDRRVKLGGWLGNSMFWYCEGIAAGTYRLHFDYGVSDSPHNEEHTWTGQVKTQDVTLKFDAE